MKRTQHQLQRPIRLCLTLLGVLATLFAVTSPFVPVPHASYLLGGLLYSAFLSMFAGGFALAPRASRIGLILGGIALATAGIAWFVLLYAADPERLGLFISLLHPLQVTLIGWLVTGSIVSIYGWVKFFRGTNNKA
jgi:hypothetical protein